MLIFVNIRTFSHRKQWFKQKNKHTLKKNFLKKMRIKKKCLYLQDKNKIIILTTTTTGYQCYV